MDWRTVARLVILPLGLRAQPRQDVLAVGRSRAQIFDAGVALLAVADEIAMAAVAAGCTTARPSVSVGRCGVALEEQASRALRELVRSMAAPVHLHTAWQMRVSGELAKHDEHGAIAGSRKKVSAVPGSRAAAPAS